MKKQVGETGAMCSAGCLLVLEGKERRCYRFCKPVPSAVEVPVDRAGFRVLVRDGQTEESGTEHPGWEHMAVTGAGEKQESWLRRWVRQGAGLRECEALGEGGWPVVGLWCCCTKHPSGKAR